MLSILFCFLGLVGLSACSEVNSTSDPTYTQATFALVYTGTCEDLKNGASQCKGKSQSETMYTGIHPGDGVSFTVSTLIGGVSYYYEKIVTDTVNQLFSGFGNVTFGESSANYGLYFVTEEQPLYMYTYTQSKDTTTLLSITYNVTGGFGLFNGSYGWINEAVTVNSDNSWSAIQSFNIFYSGSAVTTTPAPFPGVNED